MSKKTKQEEEQIIKAIETGVRKMKNIERTCIKRTNPTSFSTVFGIVEDVIDRTALVIRNELLK